MLEAKLEICLLPITRVTPEDDHQVAHGPILYPVAPGGDRQVAHAQILLLVATEDDRQVAHAHILLEPDLQAELALTQQCLSRGEGLDRRVEPARNRRRQSAIVELDLPVGLALPRLHHDESMPFLQCQTLTQDVVVGRRALLGPSREVDLSVAQGFKQAFRHAMAHTRVLEEMDSRPVMHTLLLIGL